METIGKVLLVEAKKCDREVLPKLLKCLGFQTIVAENTEEALSLLKSNEGNKIDAILLSVEILNTNALDLIEWLRKRHKDDEIIISSCEPLDELLCNTLGVAFVQKPITNFKTIDIALSNAILNRKARSQK
ncbi:MAG: hypothetical protein ACD_14C00062G0001 [uncultured bacterium]|nr:MAG: hypothetical protein ACD_14C00062G0001 [uncultured bacterium]KKQ45454.1 MAG: hypothetical protein US63_C0016G0005 [Candidatus Moranbacteria bacterium GW2011_GWC2_37_8]KKQ62486.1 MAG: hypothetical protein US82_C0010G0006 [Parcubacteria group bacterium GW2011_GWC1_38_22]